MTKQQTIYNKLGGEKAVRQLVDRFYDLMDEKEEVKPMRNIHAKTLRVSREKLFLFLSGWFGGPDLYIQKYGHPRLRQRHLPFPINEEMSNQWMLCMNQALDEQINDKVFLIGLKDMFNKMAVHMINKLDKTANDLK